jgi:flagellar L-ring protein precursor FlgH
MRRGRAGRLTSRLLLLATVMVAGAGPAAAQSLYRDGAPGAVLFDDFRARRVNDLVTILIIEESSSSRSAATSSQKDTARSASVGKFPTFLDPLAKKAVKPIAKATVGGYQAPSAYLQDSLTLDLSGSAKHGGKGSIERADRVSGQITARVVKVLENGNLVLEGRRAVLVNGETQTITISGVVRPQDVTAANTVLSSQLADAEVQMEGTGVLAEAQRPGILYRLLDWLGLF